MPSDTVADAALRGTDIFFILVSIAVVRLAIQLLNEGRAYRERSEPGISRVRRSHGRRRGTSGSAVRVQTRTAERRSGASGQGGPGWDGRSAATSPEGGTDPGGSQPGRSRPLPRPRPAQREADEKREDVIRDEGVRAGWTRPRKGDIHAP